jgi:hypothetical protein
MIANTLVFLHHSAPRELVNIVEDGQPDRLMESLSGPCLQESHLFGFFVEDVHHIWEIMPNKDICERLWKWFRSYVTSPKVLHLHHPMVVVVHALCALSAGYIGDEVSEQRYFRLARSEIPLHNESRLTLDFFIALSLLVRLHPDAH